MDQLAFLTTMQAADTVASASSAWSALDYGPVGGAVAMLLLFIRYMRNGMVRGGDNPGHSQEILDCLRRLDESATIGRRDLAVILSAIQRDLAVLLDRSLHHP